MWPLEKEQTETTANYDFAVEMRENLEHMEEKARTAISIAKKSGKGEVIAQATIALRHIEDARMRYGKVIQYDGDGESCYNK